MTCMLDGFSFSALQSLKSFLFFDGQLQSGVWPGSSSSEPLLLLRVSRDLFPAHAVNLTVGGTRL